MGWIGFWSEEDLINVIWREFGTRCWSKQELIDIIQRELYSKSNLEKMVIEIEREIYIPPVVSQDEIRKLIEKMLTEHHSMADKESKIMLDKADLQKIRQEVILSLKQEIYEEISRAQVDLGNKFEGRIHNLEDEVTNLPKYTPVAPSPVDFTLFQNAIMQIQAKQKRLGLRLTKIEAKLNAPQPTAVPVGGSNTLQEQRLFELEKQNASQVRELTTLKRQLESLQKQIEKLINSGVVPPSTQSALPVAPFQIVKPIQPVQPVKPKIKPWIKFFSLPKPTKLMAFFHGDGLAVKTKLGQSIQGMDELITYLTQSKIVEPARLFELEKQNASQVRELTTLKRQLESLQKQIEKLINSGVVPPSTQSALPVAPFQIVKPIQPVQPVKPKIKPWIKFFSLPKPTKLMAFFHGDGLAVKTKLGQSIQGMDELITYLTQSKIVEPARASFMKNLSWCMEALEKLYEKFDFDSYEAEELSEKITDKFFKIITDNLLDNVMLAIYRGGKNAVGYQDFLQNVNRYLSKHGIYTENIEPGIVINRDMVSNIEPPITKYTSVATDDGKVDEVELLPYFMSYEDDDGKLDTVRKRGRIVLLKYGA